MPSSQFIDYNQYLPRSIIFTPCICSFTMIPQERTSDTILTHLCFIKTTFEYPFTCLIGRLKVQLGRTLAYPLTATCFNVCHCDADDLSSLGRLKGKTKIQITRYYLILFNLISSISKEQLCLHALILLVFYDGANTSLQENSRGIFIRLL